jgi:hypothetical protein
VLAGAAVNVAGVAASVLPLLWIGGLITPAQLPGCGEPAQPQAVADHED